MQITDFLKLYRFKISLFWLSIITASLIAIHLTLIMREGRTSYLTISMIFWAATISVTWDRYKRLIFESDVISGCLGALLIGGIFLISGFHSGTRFLASFPFLSGLGVALLASGIKRLKDYGQQLTSLFFLFFLGLPDFIRSYLPDISKITAKFSAFLLWYLGFPVSLNNSYISIPNGGVEVVPACSGLILIFYMLGMSLIFLMLFPTTPTKRVLVPILGVILGFVMNGIRIAHLAFLSANSNPQLFDYWHNDGGVIFVGISVVLFGLFCLLFLRCPISHLSKVHNSGETRV